MAATELIKDGESQTVTNTTVRTLHFAIIIIDIDGVTGRVPSRAREFE